MEFLILHGSHTEHGATYTAGSIFTSTINWQEIDPQKYKRILSEAETNKLKGQ